MIDKTLKILHLEDVRSDALLISQAIRKGNINFELQLVDTKDQFTKALKEFTPDIILADHSLPSFNSIEALAILQKTGSKTPFILITATMSDEFAVDIIKKGADDYILKDRLHRLPTAIRNALEKFRLEKERQISLDELIKREKRYHALFERSADGIAILSAEGKPLYVSPSIKNILGYTEMEVMKIDLFTLAHPDDVLALANVMEKVVANPGVTMPGHTTRMLHKNGSWRWIEATVTNCLHDPAINGIVDNFRDVTEKKQAQQLLIESEQFSKGVLASLRSHIAVVNKSGNIISVNKAWEDFAKENKGESDRVSTGSNYYEVCERSMADGDDFAGKTLAGIKSVFNKEVKTFVLEYPCHSPVEQRWFSVYVSPFGEDDTKVVISHQNITDRKLSETDLLESREEMQTVFNASLDAIIIIDEESKVVKWDAKTEALFGWKEEEVIGTLLSESIIPIKMREAHNKGMKRFLKTGEGKILSKTIEVKALRKDNTEVDISISISPSRIKNKYQFIGFIRDISERKAAEEKVIRLNEEVAKSEKFFKGVIESSADMITLFDPVGKIIFTSPAVSKTFGYTYEECLEINIADIVHPDDALIMQDFVMKIMMHPGVPMEGPKIRERKKDGSYIWIAGTLTNCLGTEGINAIIANFRDVTEKKLADEMLQQSEQRYRKIAHEMQMESARLKEAQAVAKVGSWEIDLQSLQVTWSEETHRIFETDPNNFLPTRSGFMELIYPEDRLKVDKALTASFNKLSPNAIEYRIITAKGNLKIVEEHWEIFYNNEGEPIRAVGTCQDITEKKKLEALLDKANNLARIGNYELDLQKNSLYWSDIIKQIHEVEIDFIPDVETAINFYKAGFSRERIVSALTDALKNDVPFDLELQIVTAKGNERWVKAIGESVWEDGKCIRLYGSFQDIDKVKNAEIKIRESEYHYRQIVETAQEGIWLIDENNYTTFVNKKMCEMLGYATDEVVGKIIQDFMDEEGRNNSYEQIKRRKKGLNENHDMVFITKNGRPLWTNISTNPILDNEGNYKGALAMISDITFKKEQEIQIQKNAEEREVLIRELTRSLNDLKQFSFITSHNFRAPLSNLIALLTLVEYETLTENNKEIMEMFKTSTRQLSKTINDLSQILIIKNNGHINVTKINIGQLLNSVKDSLAYEINNGNHTIETNLEVEEIPFNKSYLESVLINLVSNAIKYRSPERLLRIFIQTSLNQKGDIVLTVQDNGLGIDLKRHQENLFGLYQKFHLNTDGSGLGLYMVKSQILSLGGTIQVQSEVGKGTTFIITIKKKETAVKELSLLNQY